jgi:hypothetical protein
VNRDFHGNQTNFSERFRRNANRPVHSPRSCRLRPCRSARGNRR